ncbi:thiamine-phosphate kinase [Thiomicrorhabdus lithotrophica]|uniref:Thiamine-monophosphate kinase n=1 Tax=Thiomicrorhabdus lithotrophica TaxID=2949997 RepID=A0ABY8C702_9GAMM|nr:thiamine-phosphate kinase [Thiomicrorhabdus lithotrophica]WEJ61748.1 thiamine-phosphate kinase [Thiomicrorhabdus lithotrophica]
MASEFELINFLFEPLSRGLSPNEIGIGDDGAVLNVPENHQLVVVTDTLVSGVHFPENTAAYDVAWKAVAVNLSDLAAMGAQPGFYSLALTIPENNQVWLNGFAKGLEDIGSFYQIPLVGGDTTNGPLTITVTMQGWVSTGKAIRRSGAKEGDLVCVTNYIGNGALGLMVALNTLPESVKGLISEADSQYLLDALNLPQPQLDLSSSLKEFANSAIDISDGLLADLGHILEESNKLIAPKDGKVLGAQINLEFIPLSNAARIYIENTGHWPAILAGGDDYQLCFTIAPDKLNLAQEMSGKLGVKITAIGKVVSLDRVNESSSTSNKPSLMDITLLSHGKKIDVGEAKGYMHF